MRHFLSGSEFGDSQEVLNQSVPWMYDASNPYLEWFWGSPRLAREHLQRCMSRHTSEFSLRRAVLLADRDIIGGYVALSGIELRTCRRADLLTLIQYFRSISDDTYVERLKTAEQIFASVAEDELYLSRLGVNPLFRGTGSGKTLLEHMIEHGTKRGFQRFRLDVCATNVSAIALYSRVGFCIQPETTHHELPFRYRVMRMFIA